MKLRILSDLHVDVNRKYSRKRFLWVDKDILTIIAGDIAGSLEVTARFLRMHFNNVVFVGGNHILYNDDYKPIQQLHRDYRAEFPLDSAISYLENDCKMVDDVVFIGATLWTDYTYGGNQSENMLLAATSMNDFAFGRFEEEGETVPLRAEHCLEMFEESLNFIKTTYDKFNNTEKKIVLIVHHGISPKALTEKYRNSRYNAVYVSDLENYVTQNMSNLALVVHGHIHSRLKYRIGDIPVICNPCGYVIDQEDRKTPIWVRDLIIDV